ncbi:MAG: 6,7-dimethyl-8-ribityllumazine synthase [Phyllobacteriaceae bacterium]|nr:6,7-dimethyl-8-ribityllumazine synthase [Phyllobacteriaceae bacterium]
MSQPKVLIIEARFYDHLADLLLEGAKAALDKAGASYEVATVPGALEIPGVIGFAAEQFDAFVALGVIIRGETYHFDVVANESARGIMEWTLAGLCVGNGILTVENESQALHRARMGELDKGGGAALAALAMLDLKERFGA